MNSQLSYILFGATGNLAQIKIMPALCTLLEKGVLGMDSRIIAFGRRDWDDNAYREFIRPALTKHHPEIVNAFLELVVFVNGTFEDITSFEKVGGLSKGKVFYHLSVLPNLYPSIIKSLGALNMKGRLLIEKPFGNSLESAKSLEELIENFFEEKDILRIDHYLGKIGLKEIVKKRHDDELFESRLNNQYVSRIVCRLREVIDIQGRGEFYDKVGAFLDVGQNHALELIATLLMDINKKQNIARTEVIESLQFISKSLIRGQYDGYKEERGVLPESVTETYFRCGLQSSLQKFEGIEILIEAGKALERNERKEEVEIIFIDGDSFVFNIDIPKHYNAYESVIEDALNNNHDSFVGKEEIYSLWRLADVVRDNMSRLPLVLYRKGDGPNMTNN